MLRSNFWYNRGMGSKKQALLIGLLSLGVLFAVAVAPSIGRAETAVELQAKIDGQNKALASLNAEIAQYQDQLSTIGKDKDTLQNAIKTLTLEAQKLSADIKVSQAKIASTSAKIDLLGSNIISTAASIDDLKTALAKNIREMNILDRTSKSTIVGVQNFSDVWRSVGEQDAFRTGIREKTGQLATTKEVLIAKEQAVIVEKKNLVALDSQLKDQRTLTVQTQAQKNSLLATTKNSEKAYQTLLANKIALKNQMEGDLRDYESKLKYVLNPKSLPAAGSSPLAWPVDTIIITQLFGRTVDAQRLYASGTHNGVDFGAPVGTPVKAMASGVVVGSGNTDLTCPKASYGKWLYIRYDDGLSSLYGHLSLIKGQAGDRVVAGDIVAYSGSTGYATGPHLHVTIIAADAGSIQSFPSKACNGKMYTAPVAALNAYLDPMLYLPKL